ncbi:hypothetical protein HED50_24135 [Ochrobactrum oryzae]|nr:hypothetical protein [Brucella oryzae]
MHVPFAPLDHKANYIAGPLRDLVSALTGYALAPRSTIAAIWRLSVAVMW